MMKLIRTKTPHWLKEVWLYWGVEYFKKKKENKKYKFNWKADTALLLKEDLLLMSNGHCCFCDAHPMVSMVKDTIEHFKPKSLYPLDVYCWDNLFIACNICQEKGEKFNHKLLKPDALEYDFDNYFIYNALTGEIEPNPGADWTDQERAIETILLYKT